MTRKVNTLTYVKGQLTIFMIIGLLIVVIVIFTYIIVQGTTKQQLESETQEIVEAGLKKGAFQFAISECAEDVLEQGIRAIGRHGGYLPPDMPGGSAQFIGAPASKFGNNISYLIYAEGFAYYVSGGYKGEPVFFGFNRISSLRQVEGMLEKYVTENMKQCVDFESEEWKEFLAGYTVEQGEVTVDVRFAANRVTANIDYPVVINPGEEGAVLLKEWSAVIQPFAFKLFYDTLTDALEKEVTDENFNLSSALGEEGIFVERHNIGEYGDYILRMADSRLFIDGEQYVFQFAVVNRPPVLYYINENPDDWDDVIVESTDDLPDVDITAVDPDDDAVTINPQKLKADYDETQTVFVSDASHYPIYQIVNIKVTG